MKRKFIFIEIDDEISTILSKVEKAKVDEIGIMFPHNALIFQSIINLKLLKESLAELKKDVVIATDDKVGRKLLEKVGFVLHDVVLDNKEEEDTNFPPEKDPIIRVQKLKPKKTILKPQKATFRKLSLTELIADEEKKRRNQVTKKKDVSKELEHESSEFKMWSEKLLNLTIKKRNFILFLSGALGLLLFISYIALPSATIIIKPASNVIEKTTNLLLIERSLKQQLRGPERAHAIATFPVETTLEKEDVFDTTGNTFTGSNTKGKITIHNSRLKPWILIEGTRFQSPEGIVFRTDKRIEVPGATFALVRNEQGVLNQEKVPGQYTIEVVADEKDTEGAIVGARGNLKKDTKLILPALDVAQQDVIFAKVTEDMTGGVTDAFAVLTEEDVERAKKKVVETLQEIAQDEFLNFIAAQNVEKGLSLELLNEQEFMSFDVIEIGAKDATVGESIEQFTIFVKMQVKGIAYDKEEFYRVLENELKSKVHPQKHLLSIDRNSTTHRVVSSDSERGNLRRIKLSVTIKGVEEYDLNPRTKNGADIIDRITTNILGKPKDESRYFIQNMEEVNQLEIKLWPFWSASIPNLESGINIKVR